MKSCSYHLLKLFILFLLILFLWQLILILHTLKERFNRIDFTHWNINQYNLSKNTTIPRIIHQIWKDDNLQNYPIVPSQSQWIKSYPNYQIRLWTDEDINDLISTNDYYYLYSIYHSYPYSIQRADLARLIILHNQGGIYVDLDVFPTSLLMDQLLLYNLSLILPLSTTHSTLINHFLIAQKSSPILNYILHQIVPERFYQRIYLLPYLQVFSTGSFFLTRTIEQYLQLKTNQHCLAILSINDLTNYIDHRIGRSWHFIDGWIFNQIGDQPKLTLLVVVFAFVVIGIYRHSIWHFIQSKRKSFL